MKRRKLDRTKKAILLLVVAWLITLAIYVSALLLLIQSIVLANVIIFGSSIILFVISPLIVAYGIVVPLWLGKKIIQEPKQRKMMETARQILTEHPALKIAIAGSYGKTTAKEILGTVLGEGKRTAFTPGNMNTAIGISCFAQTLDGDEDILIFELGEEQVGDVRDLCNLVQPDVGIITGINEAHLSSFGTLDRTVAAVFELEDYLGNKPLYKNQESPLVASKIKSGDELAFNRSGTNGWRVDGAKTDIHGTTFSTEKNNKTMWVHTGLLGKHNIGIIGVAIAIADSIGFTTSQIVEGVRKTVPFEHRMRPRQLHDAWLIDDTYNGNSEGVQAGLLLLKELDAKRRIYVTPGLVEQGDKNREVHENIGRQVADVADIVVLMQNSVTDYISNGLQKSKFSGKLLIIEDPLEFYTNLDHFVASGDVVLMQNDWTDNYS
ncbi:hypothetical protein H7X68_02770 [Candidatus Saccharibacteria bacterium]|nr:hypothetical protein [Candidatus Saccharibacteria bacterium]